MKRAQLVAILEGLAGIAAVAVGVAFWCSWPVALVVLGGLLLVDRIT